MEAKPWGPLSPHLCPPAFQSDLCIAHFSLWVLSLPPWGLFCSHLQRCSRDLAVLQVSTLNQESLSSVLAAFLLGSCEAHLSTSQLLIQNNLLFSSLESSPWLNFFTTWIPLASASQLYIRTIVRYHHIPCRRRKSKRTDNARRWWDIRQEATRTLVGM